MIFRQQLFYEKGKIRTLTFLSSTSKLYDHSSFAEENHITQMCILIFKFPTPWAWMIVKCTLVS